MTSASLSASLAFIPHQATRQPRHLSGSSLFASYRCFHRDDSAWSMRPTTRCTNPVPACRETTELSARFSSNAQVLFTRTQSGAYQRQIVEIAGDPFRNPQLGYKLLGFVVVVHQRLGPQSPYIPGVKELVTDQRPTGGTCRRRCIAQREHISTVELSCSKPPRLSVQVQEPVLLSQYFPRNAGGSPRWFGCPAWPVPNPKVDLPQRLPSDSAACLPRRTRANQNSGTRWRIDNLIKVAGSQKYSIANMLPLLQHRGNLNHPAGSSNCSSIASSCLP